MVDVLTMLTIGVFGGAFVLALALWGARRRVRWEQAKDKLKGYHYDA